MEITLEQRYVSPNIYFDRPLLQRKVLGSTKNTDSTKNREEYSFCIRKASPRSFPFLFKMF